MKVTDLRIGNVIEYYIEETQTWEKNVVDAEDLVMFEKDEKYFLKQYRPVGLGSKRLSRMIEYNYILLNGKNHECFLDKREDAFISVFCDPFEKDKFTAFLEYGYKCTDMIKQIRYLHELQNLVFVLTGKEMEVVYE